MSGLPRGWTFSAEANGPAVLISVPATNGVAHVLTGFAAQIVNTTASSADLQILLSSSAGTFNNFILTRLSAAASGGVDRADASDLGLATAPGESLTVSASASVAGLIETLLLQGYDI